MDSKIFTILPMKKEYRILFYVFLILLCFLSLWYSSSHYADGGCDGGVCALAFIFHGLPLLISWVFLISSANFCLSIKKIFFVLIVLSSVPNFWILWILNETEYRENALYNPSYVILIVQFTLVAYFFYLKNQKKESNNLF